MSRKVTLGMMLLAGIVFYLQLVTGSSEISVWEIFRNPSAEHPAEVARMIFFQSRLPAALCSLMAGGALGISGLQMQTVLANPVAGPYVLGISSGAGLGVALLTMGAGWLGLSGILPAFSVAVAAGLGALLIFMLILLVSAKTQAPASLLIIGLMIGGVCSALIQLLQLYSEANALRNFTIWSFSSFRSVTWNQLPVLGIGLIIGLTLHFRRLRELNALLLGDDYAQTLGVDVKRIRLEMMIATAVLAGTVTAFCGPVGFIGLAVPHIARMLLKTADHRLLSLTVFLIGAVFAGLCNWFSSIPGPGFNVPINVITSIIGGPYVIALLLKRNV